LDSSDNNYALSRDKDAQILSFFSQFSDAEIRGVPGLERLWQLRHDQ
jgi:hypothetical protein